MRVLDVRCGVGGPARENAKSIGCDIVGITINQKQVDVARRLTEEAGLSDKVTFIQGDFLVCMQASSAGLHYSPKSTKQLLSRGAREFC
jgi:tRNA1(Val) A37 N6-methylase TrmN6